MSNYCKKQFEFLEKVHKLIIASLPLVSKDYTKNWISNEYCLVDSFYHHLRSDVENLSEIKILSEFKMKTPNYDNKKSFDFVGDRSKDTKFVRIDLTIEKEYSLKEKSDFKAIEVLIECKFFTNKTNKIQLWLDDFHKWHLLRTIMERPPRFYSLLLYEDNPKHCPSMLHEFMKLNLNKYGTAVGLGVTSYSFDGYFELIKILDDTFRIITLSTLRSDEGCYYCETLFSS